MTSEELIEMFEQLQNEIEWPNRFKNIKEPKSKRRDLHAFLMLDELLPDTGDIVCSAEHDQIWLDVNLDDLAKVATEEIVKDLICCGVMCDSGNNCLSMFA